MRTQAAWQQHRTQLQNSVCVMAHTCRYQKKNEGQHCGSHPTFKEESLEEQGESALSNIYLWDCAYCNDGDRDEWQLSFRLPSLASLGKPHALYTEWQLLFSLEERCVLGVMIESRVLGLRNIVFLYFKMLWLWWTTYSKCFSKILF